MASITVDRRTGKYLARVRRTSPDGKRYRQSRTFAKKHEACKWAHEIEAAFEEWRVTERTRRDARAVAKSGSGFGTGDDPTI